MMNKFHTFPVFFHFNRNSKKIKELRTHVEAFEKNVKQRAKILEQEERLKREKELLNNKIHLKKIAVKLCNKQWKDIAQEYQHLTIWIGNSTPTH